MSVQATQTAIGYAVGTVLVLGLISVLIASLAAVFIPSCPFHSPFSACIQLVLESPAKLYRMSSRKLNFKLQFPQFPQGSYRMLLLRKIKGFLFKKISATQVLQIILSDLGPFQQLFRTSFHPGRNDLRILDAGEDNET
jgi:hypothetical protein